MQKRTMLRLIEIARKNVSREIRANREIGSKFAAALSGEGYFGGYRDALDDLIVLLNGTVPNRQGWWKDKYPPLELYRYAGKIGPWARRGMKGIRYLATGPQKEPVYVRINNAEKEGDTWSWLSVTLEGEDTPRSVWCGTNTYEKA